ncbi:30S ribosome-binding factor RbfA [Dictyoglomus thermophilum]|uniref:Ribosome-binding factor A n=1 Tax=Dictyoglomus thermophilum (strain ATCC 35947 / DSM 3960 / H-6-12) TaxID=309799 RepID=RBFA_DICT6|nr:30S ribosome-binding factor RbfA [Dictyoglomus thermophilum]B5YEH6.1 RecName: Full=Ribosome-binding factor A [Dictyoglomus thermophilum H-6-12]ACI19068.1 ribosome-binding factor A [Dictyoglomus thermophilum H-6-12]MCX7721081.1 30S ribosome-binding factor RbfA [Dictyoglomus thermophilum]
MRQRQERLSALIREEISEILLRRVKDPRISSFLVITEVKMSKDLRYAHIYVSVYGSEEEKKQTMQGLESAKGFIRSELGKDLRIRFVPEIFFELDDSLEKGDRILRKLKELGLEDEQDSE